MAYSLEVSFVLRDDDTSFLQGISDVETYTQQGITYLIAASEADSAVTVFSLANIGDPQAVSVIEYSDNSGTLVVSDVTIIGVDATMQVLALGRYDNNIGIYDVAADGSLSFDAALADGTSVYERGWVGETATIGSRTFVYTASFGVRGINFFEVAADGSLQFMRVYEGFADDKILDVSEAKHFTLHDTEMLAVANTHDDSVLLYRIRGDGRLRLQDRFSDDDEGGLSAITALGSAQAEARGFMLVANAMADSISVLRVSAHGVFKLVDTFYDTRDTRFGGVTAMEVVEHNGRVFVFAGGADDGITVLELNYRGQLSLLATIADQFETTLQNVSSIDVRMIGDVAHIIVGSQTDHGITELTVDLTRTGQDIRGGTGDDFLVGTNGDDVIWGMGHNDVLSGGAGDDHLIDGRGNDILFGGSGADVFVFTPDGKSDFIEDFEVGIDRIDLSGWDHLYHIADITIETRIGGAVIFVGEDIIRISAEDNTAIDSTLFTQDTFIFG